MGAIIRFFGSRWFLTFVGVLFVGLLIWFFGPFLAFLESWIPRAIIIAVMVLIWVGVNFWLDFRRKKNEAALVAGVTATAEDPSMAASAEEVAAMRDKLTTALTLLKKASKSRGFLYEQPWFAIIGPPGAGKTTALLNAGLTFPLAAEMGQGPIAGVGGTRMCEWMFTDDAVLIDTAGRYATQDSNAAVDKAGWDAFLSLLKRTRPRQPLNGVIVAIAMTDIAAAPANERLAHARAIRQRVKELSDQLGVRMPIYVMFTKADLVAGFSEFYDDLDREKRGAVWGTTFPLNKTDGGSSGAFAAEFDLLVERLNQRLIDRLQAERSPERRVAIAGFPAQVASLRQPLVEFVQEAFGGTRLDPAPFLRGIYIASGTQEGTPIDRLTGALARSFGIDQQRAPSLRPEAGRSYFLTRLLKEVIFGEAMLVSRDPSAVKRAWMMRIGAASLATLVAILGVGALIQTSSVNKAAIRSEDAALTAYIAAAKALPLDPVNDAALEKVGPVLDLARALPYGTQMPATETQWFPGLSQTSKLGAGADQIYANALNNIFLPRLLWRLEGQMRAKLTDPPFLYEATRTYLMLGSAGPLDRPSIKEWMRLDWLAAFPGPLGQPVRDSLTKHLNALLEQPLGRVPLDGQLVDEARRTFSRVTLAERVYRVIKRSPEATGLPAWIPAEAAGAAGAPLFTRRSGAKLTDGLSGLHTVTGFHSVLLPQLPRALNEVAGDSWVLGKQSEFSVSSPAALTLQRDVVKLYTDEYAAIWDAFLAELDLPPLNDSKQSVQMLYVLSSPQSPMRDMLTAITKQLMLTVTPPVTTAGGAASALAGAAVGSAAAALTSSTSRLQAVLGNPLGGAAEPPGKAIEDRYDALIKFVGKGPGAPLDNVLKLLSDLQQQLDKVANPVPGPPAAGGGAANVATQLRAEASRDPEPIRHWLNVMVAGGSAQMNAGAKKAAVEAFNAPGGPASLCQKAVNGRYPFVAGSGNDIPLDDFGKLFAPGGMLDAFFNQQLRPFVNMSGPTWKLQAAGDVAPPVSPADLAQFQRAAAIRDLFFGPGGKDPAVRFDVTPQSADNVTKQVTIDLGEQQIVYSHGPVRPVTVAWPGGVRIITARLAFDPPPSSGAPVIQTSGPWALFKLFDKGTLRQAGSSDRYVLDFQLGDRHASFEIRAGSVLNPLAPGLLKDFKCPAP
ncbi:MAG: type VI secretion system membrane subunit TssM [Acetobacteraceae bacterium]|nr:type VI secretion system membrane subunit TssM [Acetobacteraceae bacterium]